MQARLRSVLLQLATTEQGRCNAIEGRGLVQADEGIRLQPVPADAVATVDQGHAYVGVVGQGVREGHSRGAGTHHEVVGFDRAPHESTVAPPCRRVHRFTVKPGGGRYLDSPARPAGQALLVHRRPPGSWAH